MFRGGLKTFLFIALIEHVLLTLVFSMIIYERPRPREVFERPTEVSFVELPPLERIDIQRIPKPVERVKIETSDEIPRFQENDIISQVLGVREENQNIDARARINTVLDPDQFSLDDTRIRRTTEQDDTGTGSPIRAMDVPSTDRNRIPKPRASQSGNSRVTVSAPGQNTGKVNPASSLTPRTGSPVGLPFEIRGEVEGRRLVYRPPIPEAPGDEVGEVVLTFWVSPEGVVSRVQVKRTAGDPRLVQIARDWVSRLRFEPLDRRMEQKPQWGEITVEFSRK